MNTSPEQCNQIDDRMLKVAESLIDDPLAKTIFKRLQSENESLKKQLAEIVINKA